jgi:hypothetical protein
MLGFMINPHFMQKTDGANVFGATLSGFQHPQNFAMV